LTPYMTTEVTLRYSSKIRKGEKHVARESRALAAHRRRPRRYRRFPVLYRPAGAGHARRPRRRGAWVANLAVLEQFRPYFLGAAVIALFFAWKKIYRAPAAACTPGSLCAMPQTNRIYKVLFWMVAVLVVLALIFPYLAPLFY